MSDIYVNGGVLTVAESYTEESDVPTDYLGWHSYASQMSAIGVRQTKCHKCKRYAFPKEIAKNGGCPHCGQDAHN